MTARAWRCRDHTFDLGRRTLVMGVVNVTLDSFSDGGLFADPRDAVAHAARLIDEGSDILDVGGESTRPGSDPVAIDEELARVLPVIEGIRSARPDAVISIDTRHPDVAAKAIEGGASIVNDVTAGRDPAMFPVARESDTGMILMHMLGEPKTMQDDPRYDDVVSDIHEYLRERVEAAVFAGIPADHLAVDPGIGFGKSLDHNLALLRSIEEFMDLDAALLVGASRKRFLGTLTGTDDPTDRLEASRAVAAWCAAHGADVVRVHDVRETVRALAVVDAIARGSS